jgi:hypothetical protein
MRGRAPAAVKALVVGGLLWSCGGGTPTAPGPTPTPPAPTVPPAGGNGGIAACGAFDGPGPFVVDADIITKTASCLRFSGTISGQLDCQGHDVSSVSLQSVQGFSIRNCVMHAGVNMTLRVFNSRQVTVDATDVLGSLFVSGTVDSTFKNSTFRWPVLPADPSGSFESSEVYFTGGQNNRIVQSTIDGGWDGSLATYQRQGCDDGILIQNEANSLIEGNDISNAFDAGIESGVTSIPLTATIQNNRIRNMGYTGIGAYYIQGWQNSVFSGNTVSNSPSLMHFDASGAKGNGVTLMTLVNNQVLDNTFQNPVRLPPKYGGGVPPSLSIDYVAGGLPFNVSGNLIGNNNFGTSSPGPILSPAQGFIDGGGNICLAGGTLNCVK